MHHHHPDGPIVVDTGIGFGNDLIKALYPHESLRVVDELDQFGLDERDGRLIVNSHLHFDHCGQNDALSCPVVVQRSGLVVAQQPHYTVPEWAAIRASRSMVLDGDDIVALDTTVMHTPGHTPGHQAVVLRSRHDTVVVAAQCIFRRQAWVEGAEAMNLHDSSWHAGATERINRLCELKPSRVLLTHDTTIGIPSPGSTPRTR